MAPKILKISARNKTIIQPDPTGETCPKSQAERGKRNVEVAVLLDPEMKEAK